MIGEQSKFARIAVSKLFADETYQRSRSAKKVQKIINAGWDEQKCLSLGVAARGDGSYAVWDGGHRLEAAIALGITHLPCMITPSATKQREASLFVAVNRDRSHVKSSQILVGLIVAKDPDALEIQTIASKHGFRIDNAPGVNVIRASNALMVAYDRYGAANLSLALSVLRQSWRGDKDSVSGPFIVGTTRFFARTGFGDSEATALIAKLKRKLPMDILQRSKQSARLTRSSSDASFAIIIALIYNERIAEAKRVDIEVFSRENNHAAGIAKRYPHLDAKGKQGSSDSNSAPKRSAAPVLSRMAIA